MPYKFNASRRHKFDKKKYRVTNWPDYNESLRRRGDVTMWIDESVVDLWAAPASSSRGRPATFSDYSIEICLQVRVVFGLALRQTQGFVRCLLGLMKLDLPTPDFSTLSRRAGGLQLRKPAVKSRTEPRHLVLDSTGVKIYGEGEWLQNKHKTKPTRRSWRKLHLGMDLNTGEIVCSDLAYENVGDPTILPELLDQVEGHVDKMELMTVSQHEGFLRHVMAMALRLSFHHPKQQF